MLSSPGLTGQSSNHTVLINVLIIVVVGAILFYLIDKFVRASAGWPAC
jgi:hypothetical protein